MTGVPTKRGCSETDVSEHHMQKKSELGRCFSKPWNAEITSKKPETGLEVRTNSPSEAF
jgi:hypothetical protein